MWSFCVALLFPLCRSFSLSHRHLQVPEAVSNHEGFFLSLSTLSLLRSLQSLLCQLIQLILCSAQKEDTKRFRERRKKKSENTTKHVAALRGLSDRLVDVYVRVKKKLSTNQAPDFTRDESPRAFSYPPDSAVGCHRLVSSCICVSRCMLRSVVSSTTALLELLPTVIGPLLHVSSAQTTFSKKRETSRRSDARRSWRKSRWRSRSYTMRPFVDTWFQKSFATPEKRERESWFTCMHLAARSLDIRTKGISRKKDKRRRKRKRNTHPAGVRKKTKKTRHRRIDACSPIHDYPSCVSPSTSRHHITLSTRLALCSSRYRLLLCSSRYQLRTSWLFPSTCLSI